MALRGPGGRRRGVCRVRPRLLEAEVDIEAVRYVYALRPLMPQILAGLNAELEVSEVADELRSLGLVLEEGY